jgi:hypothetical protein
LQPKKKWRPATISDISSTAQHQSRDFEPFADMMEVAGVLTTQATGSDGMAPAGMRRSHSAQALMVLLLEME